MEGRKPVGSFAASSFYSSSSSSSSSSSNLFGGKESSLAGMSAATSSSSTTGIFSSMFPPPSTILGRNSLHSDALGSLKKDSQFQIRNAKHGLAVDASDKRSDIIDRNIINKETSSVYSDQAAEPFSLSSSIYYGGRDHFAHSSDAEAPVIPETHHKYEQDGEEDDHNCSNIASRGNWWQGSLYY